MNCGLGFRIVGPAHSPRQLVDWQAAFGASCALDARIDFTQEAYTSAFTFAEEFRDHMDEYGTPKDYVGSCGGEYLWFDFDAAESNDDAIDDARRDAVRLAYSIAQWYGLNEDDLLAFFSGSKGVHIGLPTAIWQPTPSTSFHLAAKAMAISLAERCEVTIDTGVYDKVRLFRQPNSKHPKTGLHKRPFTLRELDRLKLESIREYAKTPAEVELPRITTTSPAAIVDWQAALATAAEQTQMRTAHQAEVAANGARLNYLTLQVIRSPQPEGNRRRLLYSAAKNLCEMGVPQRAALLLLQESARDSGLPPEIILRQVECGYKDAAGGANHG